MKGKSPKQHDAGYKHLLSNWRMFRSFMVSFIDEAWVNDVDYEHLELVNKSFVLKEFRKRESDLLYKARLKDGEEDFYFYILLEHQSTVDHGMPFRLLIYITELWRDVLKVRKSEALKKSEKLPAVFPIVLYNGERRWTAPRRLRGLVAGYEMFRSYVPDFRYALVDASHYDIGKLRKIRNAIAGVFLLDSAAAPGDLMKRLREALGFLHKEDRQTVSTFALWLRHVLLHELGEGQARQLLLDVEISSNTEEEVATMIETLGKRLKDEGRTEGRTEGALEEARRALIGVLEARFGKRRADSQTYYIDEIDSVATLNRLLKKAVKVGSIEDLGLAR